MSYVGNPERYINPSTASLLEVSEMNIPTKKIPLDVVKETAAGKAVKRINARNGHGSVSYIASNTRSPDNIVVIYGTLVPPITYTYDEKNRMFRVN